MWKNRNNLEESVFMRTLICLALCAFFLIIPSCVGKVKWVTREGGNPVVAENWVPTCPDCGQVANFEALQCVNPECRILLSWEDKKLFIESLEEIDEIVVEDSEIDDFPIEETEETPSEEENIDQTNSEESEEENASETTEEDDDPWNFSDDEFFEDTDYDDVDW